MMLNGTKGIIRYFHHSRRVGHRPVGLVMVSEIGVVPAGASFATGGPRCRAAGPREIIYQAGLRRDAENFLQKYSNGFSNHQGLPT